MRVIAGKFRSRPLRSLPGLDTRPTSDRLRETLFDVLTAGNAGALNGSVWLDLFAGTGAVGIEALSRGAALVYFVECSRKAAEVIRQNLRSLGVHEGFEVLQKENAKAIAQLDQQLEQPKIKPDFIFLDPPYRLQQAYAETLDFLGGSNLSARATVIAEHEKHFDPGAKFGTLVRVRQLQQSDTVLSFYRRP